MLARLEHELQSRKRFITDSRFYPLLMSCRLASDVDAAEKHVQTVQSSIDNKRRHLSKVPQLLDGLKTVSICSTDFSNAVKHPQASEAIWDFIGQNQDKILDEQVQAQKLPRPLYVLFAGAKAVAATQGTLLNGSIFVY